MRSIIINIVLMLVLGITILPIAQVGSLLYNNVLTEERSNAEDGGIESKKAEFTEPLEPGTGLHFADLSAFLNSASYIHFAETLPPSHAGDIHSPPPNA